MKDFFKFKPYKLTESFYANLSALFLAMSIITGPISIIFGLILFECYSVYLTEDDITIYLFSTIVLFAISLFLFVKTYKKYKKTENQLIKTIVKPRNIRDSYNDIYVLGTLTVILIFVTSIYFVNNNYKERINKLNNIKTSISNNLNDKVTYADKYKYLLVQSDKFNSSIYLDKNFNLSLLNTIFNYEESNDVDTEEIINDFDNNIKVLFGYMNNYKYEEYYNGVNNDLRDAINNYKNGSLNDVYLYKREFNNEVKITRNLSVTLKDNKLMISLMYS